MIQREGGKERETDRETEREREGNNTETLRKQDQQVKNQIKAVEESIISNHVWENWNTQHYKH